MQCLLHPHEGHLRIGIRAKTLDNGDFFLTGGVAFSFVLVDVIENALTAAESVHAYFVRVIERRKPVRMNIVTTVPSSSTKMRSLGDVSNLSFMMLQAMSSVPRLQDSVAVL